MEYDRVSIEVNETFIYYWYSRGGVVFVYKGLD